MANDFLPFAGAGGANVMTQAAYVALASRPTGFISGVAQSQQLNKVWRQSSIMAAVIGQIIDDWSPGDAIDDGTTAALVAGFQQATRALKNLARFTANGSWVVPAGVTQVWVTACAGGGGGGAGGTGGSSAFYGGGGGGGGAGQSVYRNPYVVVPGQTVTITVGAAGAGGAPTVSSGNSGTAGGATSMSNLSGLTVVLAAGSPGAGAANGSSSFVSGGAGGVGFPTGSGGSDTDGLQATPFGGAGASGPFGGGGGGARASNNTGAAGAAAGGFGAGGGGGGGTYGKSVAQFLGGAGGAGSGGYAQIEW